MLNKISLHHIGGRSGNRAFPVLKSFEKDIVSVLYEADSSCIEDIKKRNRHNGLKAHILSYCLGERDGKGEFNLNYDPYTSSLLKTNGDIGQYYCFYEDMDYVWGENTRAMRSFDIEVSSLDSILAKRKDIPAPDFLSIDTQGSEYGILLGARGLLKEYILGLIVEVEFKELYKDQRLFGDIEKLLSSEGFEFIKFLAIGELSPYRAPIGLRAEGQQVYADALFLKRGEAVENKTCEDYVKLRKLSFLSIVFNQLERSLLYLDKSKGTRISEEAQDQLSKYSYFRFLDEFDRQAHLIKRRYPATFADVYSFEESRSRFDDTSHRATLNDRIIRAIKNIGMLYETLRVVKRGLKRMSESLSRNTGLYLLPNTPIENLFCKYGLRELAKKVKMNRIYHSAHARSKKSI